MHSHAPAPAAGDRYYRKLFRPGRFPERCRSRDEDLVKDTLVKGDPVLRRAAISWARGGRLTPQRLWPALRELGGLEGLLAVSDAELVERLGTPERAEALRRSVEDAAAERWTA